MKSSIYIKMNFSPPFRRLGMALVVALAFLTHPSHPGVSAASLEQPAVYGVKTGPRSKVDDLDREALKNLVVCHLRGTASDNEKRLLQQLVDDHHANYAGDGRAQNLRGQHSSERRLDIASFLFRLFSGSGTESEVEPVTTEPSVAPSGSFVPSAAPTTVSSASPTMISQTMQPTIRKTPQPTVRITSRPSSSPTGTVIAPPDGSACWNTANEVTLSDVLFYLNDPTTFDPTAPRIYTFCPGTVVNIGYLGPGTGPLPFTLVGENLPLIPLNPNMHIRCGDSGQSSNNCTFVGGQEQIATQADTSLLSVLIPFLPFLIPGLSSIPVLPMDYIPDSSNLVVEGFTFERSADFEQDADDHSTIYLLGPGRDMVIKDCIFRNNGINGEATAVAYSAVNLRRDPNAQLINGVYSSLTIIDTVFEDNEFSDGVVVTSYMGTPQENDNPALIDLTVQDCTFTNNFIGGPSSCLAVIKTDLHTKATVDKSCFTDNTITGTPVEAAVVSSSDGIFSYTNLAGTGNTLPTSATCDDIAFYMLDGAMSSIASATCAGFDASVCLAYIA